MSAKDGGPAWPGTYREHNGSGGSFLVHRDGLSLRDWFAGMVQADDRLVKCVRAMDDSVLEVFALHPNAEREEHITEIELTAWHALPSEVAKVARRLELEARAIARVRYMQADALLAARGVEGVEDDS